MASFQIDGVITLKTWIGNLRVVPCFDAEYPGVKVYLNGELVSITELVEETSDLRTIAYVKGEDEPANITHYNTTKEESL